MCKKTVFRRFCLLLMVSLLSDGMLAQNRVKSFDTTELNITSNQRKLSPATKAEYARVNMKRSIPAGQWTAIVMPAALDAYYFGVAAKRYIIDSIVQQTDEGVYYIAYSTMSDSDGFKAGQPYLIKPTMDIEEIDFVTPAEMTAVDQSVTDLYCIDVTNFKEGTPDAISNIMQQQDRQGGTVWYNLLGCPVSRGAAPGRPGIYIHQGKRVLITK